MDIANITTTIVTIFTAFAGAIVYMKKQGFFENRRETTKDIFQNYLEAARQSGKKEISPFIVEMNKKLDFYHQDHIGRLDKIEGHLDKLNSKVATNREDIIVLKAVEHLKKI
jgi:hypothetical protein